jgi:hypothetical protein
MELYDADGTLIVDGTGAFGVNDATNDERIRIPAVAGQTYYLRVFGALPETVNGYDMSIINTPAPIPYGLELQDTPVGDPPPANSDTGRSQFDDVTRDNTPTIFLRLDDGVFRFDLQGNDPGAGGFPNNPPDETIPIPFQTMALAGYRVAIFDEGPTPGQPATNPQIPVGFADEVAGSPGLYTFTFTTPLSDGSHFLSARVQMIDPSDPQQTGFGGRSLLLEVIIDTVPPPVVFGDPGVAADGLVDEGGVIPQPATFNDNKTNDQTPIFWGIAEANAIVRLFADANNNGTLDATDPQIAETVAIPLDGTNQDPVGRWRVESDINLNDPDIFPGLGVDGLRRIFVTAEDLAGNENPAAGADEQTLEIFLDTQGPQVTDVFVSMFPDFDLFASKGEDGTPEPTPPVTMLSISFQDLPARVAPAFLNPFANLAVVVNPAHYRLVGDNVGVIPIVSVMITDNVAIGGMPATGTVKLTFAEPLPDDRYTLTISDEIVDDVGNPLDGENTFVFPSGDQVPGTDFVTRFTIDSRPELGAWAGGSVYIDLNGNFRFDPDNVDPANRDVAHTLGFATDHVFAGKFVIGAGGMASGFDGLASFGRAGGVSRWQIDTTGDGVPDIVTAEPAGFNPSGHPVAGNFDGNAANGDEVGLFTGTRWFFDTNHDFLLDTSIATGISGLPFVGDFNGDGTDDLGTYSIAANRFFLSITPGGGLPNAALTTSFRIQFNTPFIGGRERPVAADMNNDGADDIGLWVPDRRGITPRGTAEWYILLSRDTDGDGDFDIPITSRIVGGFIPFTPEPFGDDLFARFGDEFALPVVGNFDPPGTLASPRRNDPPSTPTPAPQTNSGNDFVVLAADAGGQPLVRLVDRASGALRLEFLAYNQGFRGGVRVATADLNGDGIKDIITGAGLGGGPHVRSFDGRTGAQLSGLLGSFFAFNPSFTGGVFVAAGDVNGDGRDDVIVSAGPGGGPHVRVYSGNGGALLGEFYAYSPNFSGGVHVAAGDVDGDGRAEIITGAGAGGGPHVRVFDTPGGVLYSGTLGSFFAYNANFRGGVFVAAGDVDGDGRAEIITGAGAGGGPHVRVLRATNGQELASFYAYGVQFAGGVRVGTTDFNGDFRAELVLSPGAGSAQPVRITDFRGQSQSAAFAGFASSASGVFVAAPPAAAAAVALASPGPSAPSAHDAVLSNWSNSQATDAVADDLVNASAPGLYGTGQPSQARRRSILLALL